MSRKEQLNRSRQLLRLAEDDKWKTVHSILVSDTEQQQQQVYSRSRTTGGDFLIHLSTFTSCENSHQEASAGSKPTVNETSLYALMCSAWVIHSDFSACNKVAGDGGSALHCALAAASSSLMNDDHGEHDDDNNMDGEYSAMNSEDDCESSFEDENEHDSESDEDEDLTSMPIHLPSPSSSSFMNHEVYKSLTNEEITCMAIQLLLNNDADANLPLANVHQLTMLHNHSSHEDGEDQDEIDMSFSREAIVNEWTPITFCIQWLVLAVAHTTTSSKSTSPFNKTGNEIEEEEVHDNLHSSMNKVMLPIIILKLLLEAGADPMYTSETEISQCHEDEKGLKNSRHRCWSALEYLASVSHILSTATVSQTMIKRMNDVFCQSSSTLKRLQKDCLSCDSTSLSIDQDEDMEATELFKETARRSSVYDFVVDMMKSKLMEGVEVDSTAQDVERRDISNHFLTPLQTLAESILCNKTTVIEDYLKQGSRWELCNDVNVCNILPMPGFAWGTSISSAEERRMTLLQLASIVRATSSLKALVSCRDQQESWMDLPQSHIRNAIKASFMQLPLQKSGLNDMTASEDVDSLTCVVNILLGKVNDEDECHSRREEVQHMRQCILDRILLEVCADQSLSQHLSILIHTLLMCGADPNVQSVADSVQGSVKPLHLIAGNCGRSIGLKCVDYLLHLEPSCHQLNHGSVQAADLLAHATNADYPQTALHIALEKNNFDVASRLWQVQRKMETEKVDDQLSEPCKKQYFDFRLAGLLGEAAIYLECIEMFEYAVDMIVSCYDSCVRESEKIDAKIDKVVGKLLLLSFDERYGFGKRSSSTSSMQVSHHLRLILDLISRLQERLPLTNIASWARDKVSGQTPLHLLLRSSRGSDFIGTLLRPLCTLLRGNNDESDKNAMDFISQHSAASFGLHTPLHIGCSIGCEASIRTLLEFGADPTQKDGDGNFPIDVLQPSIDFPNDLLETLSTK